MSEESSPRDALAEYPENSEHPEYPGYPAYAERVLEVAELIPPGRVMTYGDVAEWLEEGGPRQVGRAMALYGAAVPWWRVVRADGILLPGHELEALGHYRTEGTPLHETGPSAQRSGAAAGREYPPAMAGGGRRSGAFDGHLPRIDMRRARWDGEGRAEAHT